MKSKRSPDGAQRNPGQTFPRISRIPLALHAGYDHGAMAKQNELPPEKWPTNPPYTPGKESSHLPQ